MNLVLFLCVLMVFVWVVNRFSILAWIFFLLIPLFYFIFGFKGFDLPVFVYIKIFLVVTGMLWILFLRYSRIAKGRWPFFILYLIVLLNILVVVVYEQSIGIVFNTIAGIFLLLTLPNGNHIKIDKKSKTKDLLWDIPFLWIICYTLWDWSFCYSSYTVASKVFFVLLLAPIIFEVIKRKTYLQVRAYTLAFYLLLFLYQKTFLSALNATRQPNVILLATFEYLSFSCCLLYFGYFMFKKYRKST